MRRNFSLRTNWFSGRNRQTAIRASLGTLLLANIVATVLAFYPPGGSPEQLEGDLAVARKPLAARQQSAAMLKKNVAKVTKDSASGAHESAKASQDLSQLAVELQNIVGEFKI